MKNLKQITFWLMLIGGLTSVVFTSCKDDEPASNTVTGISLDKTTLSLETDSSYALTVALSPAHVTDKTIIWTSSDESIAIVSNGKVTGIALGTAIITAEVDDITTTSTVIVNMTNLTDIDGNVYHAIQIGTQVWMVENLKVTKYNDGTSIPNVMDETAWAALTTGAWCDYNNDAAKGAKYGKLYNWYTVASGKLAPTGWHVATDAEWTTLQTYLIANGYNYDGSTTYNYIAKSLATKTDWVSHTITGAIGNDLTLNNSTGFSALPGGKRILIYGSFFDLGKKSCWWTATEKSTYARFRELYYDDSKLVDYYDNKHYGMSVRCVRD